ncbi:MAG: rod shape-determining protein MreD [Candidatus Eisenbacteria bacterium]
MLAGFRIAFGVFLLLVSQATWVKGLSLWGIEPDLLLGMVFFVALKKGIHWGVWTGFAIGLLIDLEEPSRLGLHALAYVLTSIAVERWSKNFDRSSPIVVGVLLFLVAVLTETIRLFAFTDGGWFAHLVAVFRFTLPTALYTTLFLALASWILSRLLGWKDWVLHAT